MTTKHSGAGALIVEDYFDKKGWKTPCLVLGKDRKTGKYSDFGGKLHKTLEGTAKLELQQETADLVNIDQSYFTVYVDIPTGNPHLKYRGYILKVNGIRRRDFESSHAKLKNGGAPSA